MKEIKKRGIGIRFAINGLKEAFIRERNFRIHIIIAFVVIVISFRFSLSLNEWLFILLAIQLVLMAELTNSIAERMIDYVKPEIHKEAKIIKDIGAAVVLIAAIFSVIIGLIVFLPKLYHL